MTLEEAAAFTQGNSASMYKSARKLYEEGPYISISELQKMAAEMAHHTRWILGVEDVCMCNHYLESEHEAEKTRAGKVPAHRKDAEKT